MHHRLLEQLQGPKPERRRSHDDFELIHTERLSRARLDRPPPIDEGAEPPPGGSAPS